MRSLAWGIAAILAALADLALFAGPLPLEHSGHALLVLLLAHAAICVAFAFAALLLLPAHYRKPRWLAWLLLGSFSFIVPVIGPLCLLYITHTTLQRPVQKHERAKPVTVSLPEYGLRAKEVNRSGQGAIRSRLSSAVPDNVRMQSLLTLSSVPRRVSNPILEDLLGDATDDVRLVAFGMLDSEEKKISDRIHRERKILKSDLTPAQRYTCLCHLAELHWELVYSSLASGDLAKHILGEAREYLDAAFAIGEKPGSGILVLRGRILLAQGELGLAEQSLINAIMQGHPHISVLPYLSEIAFRRRDFAVIRGFMEHFTDLQGDSRLKGIADLWTGSRSMESLRDSRFLPHI